MSHASATAYRRGHRSVQRGFVLVIRSRHAPPRRGEGVHVVSITIHDALFTLTLRSRRGAALEVTLGAL